MRRGFLRAPCRGSGADRPLPRHTGHRVRRSMVGAQDRGFGNPGLFPSLFVSLESATISLAIITLFGVPLAYLLARSTGRVASFIGLVVIVPLALPPLMSGILLIYLVGPYTYLGQLFDGRLTMSWRASCWPRRSVPPRS